MQRGQGKTVEIHASTEEIGMSAASSPIKALRNFGPKNPIGEGISFIAAFAAGAVFNLARKKFWRRAYGHDAPTNPSQPGVNWGEAFTWALVTGAAAGAAKVIARRGTDLAQRRLA